MIYTIASYNEDLSQFGEVLTCMTTWDAVIYYVILNPAQFCYLMLKYTPSKEEFAEVYTTLFLWFDGTCTLGSRNAIKQDLEKKGLLCISSK